MSLLTGACQSLGVGHRTTVTEVVAPVAPSECYLLPTEPEQTPQPVLDPLPAQPQQTEGAAPAAWLQYERALRIQAQTAGAYYRHDAENVRNALDTNEPAQRVCAEFHRLQRVEGNE